MNRASGQHDPLFYGISLTGNVVVSTWARANPEARASMPKAYADLIVKI